MTGSPTVKYLYRNKDWKNEIKFYCVAAAATAAVIGFHGQLSLSFILRV